MKITDVKPIHLLTGEIIRAERWVKESEEPWKPGYANIPSAGRAHDQSGAGELPEVAIARTALANRITEAFRQYRKDLVKAFQKYEPGVDK